jgi:hypothetical protein
MKIINFEADDQDALEKKETQNEEAVKVGTSRKAVDVDGSEVDVDDKYLVEESVE